MLKAKNQFGEITTLLTIVSIVVIGILTVISSSFLKNPSNKIGATPQARVSEDYVPEAPQTDEQVQQQDQGVEVQLPATNTVPDQNTEQNGSEFIGEPTSVPVTPQELTPVPPSYSDPNEWGVTWPTATPIPKKQCGFFEYFTNSANCVFTVFPPTSTPIPPSYSDPNEWGVVWPIITPKECTPGVNWTAENSDYCYAKYAQEHPTPTTSCAPWDYLSHNKGCSASFFPDPSPTLIPHASCTPWDYLVNNPGCSNYPNINTPDFVLREGQIYMRCNPLERNYNPFYGKKCEEMDKFFDDQLKITPTPVPPFEDSPWVHSPLKPLFAPFIAANEIQKRVEKLLQLTPKPCSSSDNWTSDCYLTPTPIPFKWVQDTWENRIELWKNSPLDPVGAGEKIGKDVVEWLQSLPIPTSTPSQRRP